MLNFLKNQLAKVIEWENQPFNVLWQKWDGGSDEVINASKLIIKPGQGAGILYEGELVALISEEGIYNLETDNHPFITTLLKIRQSFESEHKLSVYFFRTAQIVDERWGTSQPIKYVDPIYKFPIEMGCNGSLSYKLNDITFFYKNVIGSLNVYTTEDMQRLFLSRIPTYISSFLAQNSFGYNQIDAEQISISNALQNTITKEVASLGISLTDFKILGTNFSEETDKHIQKIAQIQSDNFVAKEVDMNYAELEKLRALRDAAQNEGGLAGAGVGLGAGMELGKDFTGNFTANTTDKSATTSTNPSEIITLIEQLKTLFDKGILTEKEFSEKKQELLKKL